jgi:hypothetical protein
VSQNKIFAVHNFPFNFEQNSCYLMTFPRTSKVETNLKAAQNSSNFLIKLASQAACQRDRSTLSGKTNNCHFGVAFLQFMSRCLVLDQQ